MPHATIATAPLALNFHSDAGHGWLEAPAQLVRDLKIAGVISGYSYVSRDRSTVYLEEDCDAPLLLNTLKKVGRTYALRYLDNEADSFIRDLPRYAA